MIETQCPYYKKPVFKKQNLIYKRKDLLYSIENYSFVEGDVLVTDSYNAHHQVFDITQQGNIDIVNRTLSLAHAEVTELLYPYTKEEIDDEQEDIISTIEEPEEYKIELLLPEGFSKTTVLLLEKHIHDYLVSRVLAHWYSIVNPASKDVWELKLHEIKDSIRTTLLSRRKNATIKPSVF